MRKFKCIKSYGSGEWLTKGKIYTEDNGSFEYDDGWVDKTFRLEEDGFNGDEMSDYLEEIFDNQTPTLDKATMIEKLDEYCSETSCDECVFENTKDDSFDEMTDEELLSAYNLAFGNDQSKLVNNSESTFTITITPSISTLTDGTITTTIKRYHTDEHNERSAMNELIRRYYMEKNMVNVGDTIRITEQTKTLSTNKELLLHHNIPLATALKWSMYKAPMCGEEFKVVNVLKDLESRDLYCLVENEYDAYIVEMEGIVNVGK